MTQIKLVELSKVVSDPGEKYDDGSWEPDSEPKPMIEEGVTYYQNDKMTKSSEVFEKSIDRSLAEDFNRNMSHYYKSPRNDLADSSNRWRNQKKEFFRTKNIKVKPSELGAVTFHQHTKKKSSAFMTDA